MPELCNPFVFERVELICQNADAKTLANYFHAQGWFIKLGNGLFKKALQTNNRPKLLTLIKSLPETMQDQIAADFSKVYAFLFSKNDNFAGLLGFLRDISKKEISALSELKYLDQVLYSLANFPTEFYQCYYFACQHEETQKLWTIRKDYYWESTALNGDLSKVIGKLEKEVQILFWEELRGNSLKTIAKEFNHKIYISFYFENYPHLLTISNNNKLRCRCLNPIFHVKLVINKQKRLVTVYADSRHKQQKLHVIIAKIIFSRRITKYSKDSEFFDPQLFLQQLITGQKFSPLIRPSSNIIDIYVTQVTLINLFAGYSELAINTKQIVNDRQSSSRRDELIHLLLHDQKDIGNPAKYLAKSIEFTAIINEPDLRSLVRKNFMINKQGQTNLGFDYIDEQIKDCLKAFSTINIKDYLPANLRKFLTNLMAKIDHINGDEVLFTPQDIGILSADQLTMLEAGHLLQKYSYPKFGWCSYCDHFSDIITNHLGELFFCCLRCNSCDLLNNYNTVQYFTSFSFISLFLQTNLGLFCPVETLSSGRLFYLGQKMQISYYLLIGVNKFDSDILVSSLIKNPHSYVFCLENNHNITPSKPSTLLNLIDYLTTLDGKLTLILPEIFYHKAIAKLGGIAKSRKQFGKARDFVRKLFQEKAAISKGKTKKVICLEILQELQKRPDLTRNLSEDNLLDWISKIRLFK